MRVDSVRAFRKLLVRGWDVARTKALWAWRLNALGNGSILKHCLQVSHPGAVAIGSRVTIERDFVLADLCPDRGKTPKIIIGDGCTILYRFQCNAAEMVRIGNNVLIASNVLITDSDHIVEPGAAPVTRSAKFVTGPVCIEDNCWIGQNAVILKGVTVGHDSIVGAGSIVTHDVPTCSVVAGNPAKLIRRLEQPAATGQRNAATP